MVDPEAGGQILMTKTPGPLGTSTTATVRWGAWFGDRDRELRFPDGWEVETFGPADGKDLDDAAIEASFAAPVGTPTIAELARGRHAPCIVIDDLTRPTPGARILPLILRELQAAGIDPEDVLILAGVANHHPLTLPDFRKKLGSESARRCVVRNHVSWGGCRQVGTTSRGTPIAVNSEFLDADLRILVGSIMPHDCVGFSGGAKLIVPGIASIETAAAHHGPSGPATALGATCPPSRADVEEAARMVGVDCIVNVIPNSRRGIAGLVVGDVVDAHRKGLEIARRVFSTATPSGYDVCVLSCYPKDTEFLQYLTAFSIWRSAIEPIVHEAGTVVVASAASEGAGFHGLHNPRMRLWTGKNNVRALVAPRNLVFYAPGIHAGDINGSVDDGVWFKGTWQETVRWLRNRHGAHARVAVFPCAPIQLSSSVCLSGVGVDTSVS
jgi:nickel-dependent lactate racemase